MHSLLMSREIGQTDCLALRRHKTSSRAMSIQLSSDKNMQQVFNSGVNSLDLETQTNRFLIAGSSESKIAIYDIYTESKETNGSTCRAVASLDKSSDGAHQFSIETVQWYPRDNGMFVTSSMDKSVKVWDSNTLQVAEEFSFSFGINCHHMSAIARKHCLVAVACDASKIFLCDLKSGSSSHVLKGHKKSVVSVCWSTRSEHVLASGSSDNRILLWDVRKASSCMASLDQHNGKGIAISNSSTTAHNGHINGLTFSSDGLHLLSYGTDDSLRLWDVFSTENSLVNYGRVYNLGRKHVQLAVSNGLSQDLVFVPSDNNIIVFELYTGKRLAKLVGHYGNVNCCYYDKHFQELYSGGVDTHLLLWSPYGITEQRIESQSIVDVQGTQEAQQDAWSSDEDT